MLTLTDSITSFILNEKEAIDLELRLNISKHGVEWRVIADVLYNYGSRILNPTQRFKITTEQLNFLQFLQSRESWEDCRNLGLNDII